MDWVTVLWYQTPATQCHCSIALSEDQSHPWIAPYQIGMLLSVGESQYSFLALVFSTFQR